MDNYYQYGRKLYKIEGLTVATYRVVGLGRNNFIRLEDEHGVEKYYHPYNLDTNFSISKIEIIMRLKVDLERALDKVNDQYYDFLEDFTQKIHRKDKTEWHKKN